MEKGKYFINFASVMATEIEHKYLVNNDCYRQQAIVRHHIMQGFLCRQPQRTVRVRVVDDKQGYLTVKGKTKDASRQEFEYPIPIDDARQLLAMCEPCLIDKTRHIVMHDGNRWEVDEFHGNLEGLVLAELEIPSSDYSYTLPSFVGQDVTDDPRYYNACLATMSSLSDMQE